MTGTTQEDPLRLARDTARAECVAVNAASARYAGEAYRSVLFLLPG